MISRYRGCWRIAQRLRRDSNWSMIPRISIHWLPIKVKNNKLKPKKKRLRRRQIWLLTRRLTCLGLRDHSSNRLWTRSSERLSLIRSWTCSNSSTFNFKTCRSWVTSIWYRPIYSSSALWPRIGSFPVFSSSISSWSVKVWTRAPYVNTIFSSLFRSSKVLHLAYQAKQGRSRTKARPKKTRIKIILLISTSPRSSKRMSIPCSPTPLPMTASKFLESWKRSRNKQVKGRQISVSRVEILKPSQKWTRRRIQPLFLLVRESIMWLSEVNQRWTFLRTQVQ